MYKVFYTAKNGHCHYGQPFDDPGEAFWIAYKLRNVAPSIKIIDSGNRSVFESESGKIIRPSNLNCAKLDSNQLPVEIPQTTDQIELLLNQRHRLRNRKSSQQYKQVESVLLAVASRHQLNLLSFGWSI